MSRGVVNVVLYDIEVDAASVAAFIDDPEPFVDGRSLSDEERAALMKWDVGKLYALGAHPFLLLQAARSIAVHRGLTMPEFLAEYRTAVERHGYPDFIT